MGISTTEWQNINGEQYNLTIHDKKARSLIVRVQDGVPTKQIYSHYYRSKREGNLLTCLYNYNVFACCQD